MESILSTIKKLVGIAEDDTSFDTDIIIGINTAFATLTQIGVGPIGGFSIQDASDKWTDFFLSSTNLESVKTFIYLKVKLLFDPPANASLLESTNNMINELTFRLNVEAE